MSTVSTHVLDLVRGGPAAGVAVLLERLDDADGWVEVGNGETDADGRLRDLLPADSDAEGTFRLTFDTGAWFESHQVAAFYPSVAITFAIPAAGGHYHVPLLLGPFGYSTYRGS